jgi:angio-associated migratory cell protein
MSKEEKKNESIEEEKINEKNLIEEKEENKKEENNMIDEVSEYTENDPGSDYYTDNEEDFIDEGKFIIFIKKDEIENELILDEKDIKKYKEEEEEEDKIEDEEEEGKDVEEEDDTFAKFLLHKEPVYSVSFNPKNSTQILTTSNDETAYIIDFDEKNQQTKELYKLEGHKETITIGSYNFDGSLIATADLNGLIKIWDSSNGNLMHDLDGHSESVEWIKWHSKGNVLISGSSDKSTWMW